MQPRWRLLTPVLRMAFGRSLNAIAKTYGAMTERSAAGEPVYAPPPAPISEDHLQRALAAVRATGAVLPALDVLESVIRRGSDVDAARMRPYALADVHQLDRRVVLETCLESTRQGLLELRWEVICPSCRGAASTLSALSALETHSRCAMCELDFEVELESAVEVAFAPNAAVRRVDMAPFCIAGPVRVAHVHTQLILGPGATRTIEVPRGAGEWRLFLRGGTSSRVLVEPNAPEDVVIMGESGCWRDLVRVHPSGRLEVQNPTNSERHVKLERTARVRDAASAGEVTALPGFRRQFGSDVLRAGLSMSAGRLAFLFSDLVGSTALYSEIGDAAAFRLVREHFDVLLPILEGHGGSLVKTIGDAIMAVFSDDRAAVRAGLDILRAFEDFRTRSTTHAQLHLKLGVHSGPAYAVRANDTLDYFGQTVNVASRIQAEAGPGELVTDDRTVRDLLKCGGLDGIDVGAPYAAALKGVSGTLSLIRLTLDPSPHPELRRRVEAQPVLVRQ